MLRSLKVFVKRPIPMFDPDLITIALLLFVVIAALLFPGGPGTPRRSWANPEKMAAPAV